MNPEPKPIPNHLNPSDSATPSRIQRLTDHRTIGLQYLALALIAVAIGTLLSLLMRIHLVWPDWPLPLHGPTLPEDYLALVTIHGTIMLFFVLTTAPQAGFGNLILPAQIGARRMAFPIANAASFWITALALVTLLSASFVPGGSAISGWTAYPPLSAVASAGPGQGLGMDLWLASIGLFAVASLLSSINTLTTILRLRCPGMTWERLPLTVWGWFTAAMLSIVAFSVLLAALVMLFCDRHAGTSFFIPAGDLVSGVLHTARGGSNGSPLLWLHLFWFFGHPEVYIAILPGMGLTSMLLATFAHRRVFAYRTMIATTLMIGFLGILLWGHHMFVAGLSPFAISAFSVSTIAIALPASAKVLSWLATIWRSRPSLTTPMLFSLGFVSLFLTGGLTGPILAQPILDNTSTTPSSSSPTSISSWRWLESSASSPLRSTGSPSSPPLPESRHASCPSASAKYTSPSPSLEPTPSSSPCTSPDSPANRATMPSSPASPTGLARCSPPPLPLNRFITCAALFLATAQLLFLYNLVRSFYRGELAQPNPWQSTTLEWHPALAPNPPAGASKESITVYREPCQYTGNPGKSFLPPVGIGRSIRTKTGVICTQHSRPNEASMPAIITPVHNDQDKKKRRPDDHDGGFGRRPPNDKGDKRTGGGGDGDKDNWGSNHGPRHKLTTYRQGLFFALGAVMMFFAAIVGAFFVTQASSHINASNNFVNEWLPTAVPPILWLNTAVLLLSSVSIEIARRRMFREVDVMDEWLGLGKPITPRRLPLDRRLPCPRHDLPRRSMGRLASTCHGKHLPALQPQQSLLLPHHLRPRRPPARRSRRLGSRPHRPLHLPPDGVPPDPG